MFVLSQEEDKSGGNHQEADDDVDPVDQPLRAAPVLVG